jgi:polyisoprenyl-phosphate glycosyltransferase
MPVTISVVIPAHNEQESLPRLVPEVCSVLTKWSYEIVIVDDGSFDGTWEVIGRLRVANPHVRGVRLTRNFGHQAALVAGLRKATGAAVIMMDADGQHPAGLLRNFVEVWQGGSPIVQAVRVSSADESWLKRRTSAMFYGVWSRLSGVPIVRGAADFRLIDRGPLDVLLASSGSLVFLRGLIPWLGYDISYLSFDAAARLEGTSKYTWRRMLRFSIDGLMAFSVVPLRLAMAIGVTMAGVSFVYLCYVVVIALFSSRAVAGWGSTAGLIALVGGIQLFTIGVLGEYVGRIFLRTTDRPQFVIAEETVAGELVS